MSKYQLNRLIVHLKFLERDLQDTDLELVSTDTSDIHDLIIELEELRKNKYE